ncbi:SRPBCC family protein [Nocardioides sp.]|uniref:SRPBCC family protein n=1 Tax=Nocardioides sp. TaxID=35761 RepID=UPI003D1054F3
MTIKPTGTRATRGGHDSVVFTRDFRAPIESVWAAITESDRLERWIGTWTGDPATGSVLFHMNAEGDNVSSETFTINACEPPHRIVVTSTPEHDDNIWHFELDLVERGGTTTLTFSQSVPNAELAAGVGPGWDYYLDRLVAAESGVDVATVVWDDYYPAQSVHYRTLFG